MVEDGPATEPLPVLACSGEDLKASCSRVGVVIRMVDAATEPLPIVACPGQEFKLASRASQSGFRRFMKRLVPGTGELSDDPEGDKTAGGKGARSGDSGIADQST